MTLNQILSAGEAADRIRMLRSRVLRLARAGVVPHIALPDGEIRFDRDDLDAWVAKHKQPATTSEEPPDGT